MPNSQNGEEQVIADYFGTDTGRALDIGAYDGRTFSNTYALLERGWSGVLVEPDPVSFAGCIRNTAQMRVTLVHAALAAERGLVTLFSSGGDALSTTHEPHRRRWQRAGVPFVPMLVPTITIQDLLVQCPPPYEFVSLDTEGTNLSILRTLPLSSMGTRLICVEHDNQFAAIAEYCAQHGLTRELARNGENVLIGR